MTKKLNDRVVAGDGYNTDKSGPAATFLFIPLHFHKNSPLLSLPLPLSLLLCRLSGILDQHRS